MDIKKRNDIPFSKSAAERKVYCRADKETIVFSFKNICSNSNYNFDCFKENGIDKALYINEIFKKMQSLSSKTWNELYNLPKDKGFEYIYVKEFNQPFINSLPYVFGKDEKLIAVRFNGKSCRLIFKRGSKCGRVAQLLGIDLHLTLYKHV